MFARAALARGFCVAGVKNFAVVGGGQMGRGIAIVAAHLGKLNTQIVCENQKGVDVAKAFVDGWIDKELKKNKTDEKGKAEFLKRVSYVTDLQAVAKSDFVVEAVWENFDLKKNIFSTLDSICAPHTILASNTSSISITKIAATTKRPHQVIGMHFFNPVPVMNLVEMISAIQTNDHTRDVTRKLSAAFGKEVVNASDVPGFIANRVLMPWLNEAIFCLQEGIATPEDIDQAMKLGCRVPMGPLTLADFIGLDTVLSILEVLHEGHGDPKFRPCPLLRKYVDAGWLGQKSGRGFYDYSAQKK